MEGGVEVMSVCRSRKAAKLILSEAGPHVDDDDDDDEEGAGRPSSKGELRAAQRLLSIKARLLQRHNIMHGIHAREEEQELMKMSEEEWSSLQYMECLPTMLVFQIVETLYRDHPGAVWRAASREALDQQIGKEHGAKNLVYGEISFIALEALLSKYVPLAGYERKKKGENERLTFYDLGCGSGRVVFIASLLHRNITKSCGIEILPSMHRMDKELLCLYKMEVSPKLHIEKQKQAITFIHGDFLKVDLLEANLLFSNATCFDDHLFAKLENHAMTCLKKGSIVISVTRCFSDHTVWELLEKQDRRMSWSHATVYVQKKLR